MTKEVHFHYDPDHNTNDGTRWSEMDIADLTESLGRGDTIEEAAGFLCRAATVEEVEAKAHELGLDFQRSL